jgi:hypothetical protein
MLALVLVGGSCGSLLCGDPSVIIHSKTAWFGVILDLFMRRVLIALTNAGDYVCLVLAH